MTVLKLNLNSAATALMGTNTRLRVKKMTRGGVDLLALRPSYRVSGKNVKVLVDKAEDGTSTVVIDETTISGAGAPVPAIGTQYKLVDVGYGWLTVKAVEGEDATPELLTVEEFVPPPKGMVDLTETKTVEKEVGSLATGETTETTETGTPSAA